jgi:nucleoside-diphosphate-sugar epimerase
LRVFLTGASGFIGSHVTRALLNDGHTVLALVSRNNPMWRLKDLQGKFDVLEGRLDSTDILHKGIKNFQPDACIHLAWYTEPGKYLYSEKNIDNLFDSVSLFRILASENCQKIVMAGTCAEYDTDFGYLYEETPTNPATVYAAAKLSCYYLCEQMAKSTNIDFAWGRIFFPFGPGENEGRLIPSAVSSFLQNKSFKASSGDQVRDFIFIEDVANAFCQLLKKNASGVYNISMGVPVTVRLLLESIQKLLNKDDLIEFGSIRPRSWDPPFICGANDKLKALGWKPHNSLNDGLIRTIKYWQVVMGGNGKR